MFDDEELIVFKSYYEICSVLFYQGRFIEVWPLFTGWSLFGGGL